MSRKDDLCSHHQRYLLAQYPERVPASEQSLRALPKDCKYFYLARAKQEGLRPTELATKVLRNEHARLVERMKGEA